MMAQYTSSGQTLAGKDFSSAFSCSAETFDLKSQVNLLASYCCGTGVSTCWVDHSYLCADPSSWTPSTVPNGETATCIQLMDWYTQDGPTAPGQHPRALVVNHLGVTLGAAPRATLSAPTPSTPPLWAAASLRRSARCPFSPFSWDCIERVVTPVFTLPPSSRSSRNVRESKFTVRRTSRTPPSLPPPSSIPNLFIYHSKSITSRLHTLTSYPRDSSRRTSCSRSRPSARACSTTSPVGIMPESV